MCQNIDEILKNEDIEGLIAAGAPDDEYNSEAEKISQAIKASSEATSITTESLVLLISEIWQDSFNLSDEDMLLRETAIINTAGIIKNL